MSNLILRRAPKAAVLAAALALAACSAVATPSPTPVATPSPQATASGPTAFADWIAREGFGGSSGLSNVNKLVIYLNEHPSYGLFDIDADAADVANLIAWLDAHPATACWTDYHASVTASLHAIADGYAAVHTAVAAGKTPPIDVVTAMAEESGKALALPAPANCP